LRIVRWGLRRRLCRGCGGFRLIDALYYDLGSVRRLLVFEHIDADARAIHERASYALLQNR
jgi:hypothetical protein